MCTFSMPLVSPNWINKERNVYKKNGGKSLDQQLALCTARVLKPIINFRRKPNGVKQTVIF